jgi:bacteriocin-like protein
MSSLNLLKKESGIKMNKPGKVTAKAEIKQAEIVQDEELSDEELSDAELENIQGGALNSYKTANLVSDRPSSPTDKSIIAVLIGL